MVFANRLDHSGDSSSAGAAIERLQNIANDYVEVLGNLGVIVGIAIPESERCYITAGYTDIGKTQRVGSDHLYQIGSQSKTMVTVTTLLLERSGLLRLDDPVIQYLDFPIDRRITIRHLLMNASGLGEFTMAMPQDRYDPRIRYSPRDLVTMALPQGQIFDPGDHFDYCNTGWVLAALIIEAVTGEPYGEVIRKRVLQPLGLQNMWFGGGAPKERMLRGYVLSPALPEPVDSADCLSWAFGAGDGVANADDMLSFYGALLLPDNPIDIGLSRLNEQTGKHSANPYFALSIGTEYGLGLERRAWAGREVWGHPGSTLSYLTSTWIDAQCGATVTTCVTRVVSNTATDSDLRYPRAQLFAMALNAAYAMIPSQ